MHINNGQCLECKKIFNAYPGFDTVLLNWFTLIQAKFPEFHVCEAGRGHIAQEVDFHRGASRSHWTESAHNWNAGMDTFWQPIVKGKATYSLDRELYQKIEAEIPYTIEWYGRPHVPFYERPHFQRKDWQAYARSGRLKLVEEV